jgi:hypothetical protein
MNEMNKKNPVSVAEDLIRSQFPKLRVIRVSKNRLSICHPTNIDISLELRLPHDNIVAEGTIQWPGIKQSFSSISGDGSIGEVTEYTRWADDSTATPTLTVMKWEDWVLDCLQKLSREGGV